MEFATGALGTLLPKLCQLLQDEYDLQTGVKNNIKFLIRELESMHAALRTVSEVPREQLRELVRIWARDVREVSYDMEDIVDTFLVRVQGPERPSKRSAKRFIKKMKDVFTKAPTRHEIGQEIKDIKERVEEIAKRRDRYMVDNITPVKTVDVDPRLASLYTKAADLVGIDDSRDELITRLAKGDDTSVQKQRIVSIVGFGGLGKTTLAKVVYDRLKGQFSCTAFVPAGRNPNLKKVLMDILIDLDKKYMSPNFAALDERQLINESKEFLEKKRYFIVIDDVWETRSWETIKLAFVENNSGSRIIITSRNLEVAKQAGEVYKLQPLSDDNPRKLFFGRIYGDENNFSGHQQDDEVSDKILKKCEGIPLAIITMASLLVGKPSEEWAEVHRSIDFGNKENLQVENTMKILSFSYYDLPSHLRTCLLHLSMFPEDYFIEKGPLIWMWIAEGFVHRRQGISSSFEIGEGYFNELVNRSMIQLVEKWNEWNRTSVHGCHIHDMVLDLIRSISCEEKFVTILDNDEEASSSSSEGKVRRLALQNNGTVEAHLDMQQVRSFISWGFDIDKGPPCLISFKLIRVLAIDTNFQRSDQRWHLKHLRNLLHLRYLWLIGSGGVELPEKGIGTLKFLQTLDVQGYDACNKIVRSVGLLTKLLCLRLRDSVTDSITILPDVMRKLTSLEELQICFGYHRRSEEDALRLFMKALGSLRELRVLRIRCFLPLSVEVQIDLLESLHNLKKMKHLTLEANSASTDTATWEATGFLLPGHLQQLFLCWISFSRFPSFCVNPTRLPILSHLSIVCVDSLNEQDLRVLGLLPELCFLFLHVKSTTEMVCDTTADATGQPVLFKQLRHLNLYYSEVRLLPSKDDSSGVPFRMRYMHVSVLLGPEWEGVCSGKDLVPTLMPRVRKLSFRVVSVRDFIYENHGGSLCLEYFASLQHIRVYIYSRRASDAELEEVEAAVQHAAEVHPNRPTLHAERCDM